MLLTAKHFRYNVITLDAPAAGTNSFLNPGS